VCQLSSTKPVVVALEFGREDGQALDQYIHGDSKITASGVLSRGAWVDVTRDGRTSKAMFLMIERLRQLAHDGRHVDVVGIQPTENDVLAQNYSELGMADALRRSASTHPDATILVLVGNIHARKIVISRPDDPDGLRPAASLLPPSDVLALRNESAGGAAWYCSADVCGEHAIDAPRSTHSRQVVIDPRTYDGYDGYFSVGHEYTPSKPATAHSRTVDEGTVPVR
jgi:hypothetical protein